MPPPGILTAAGHTGTDISVGTVVAAVAVEAAAVGTVVAAVSVAAIAAGAAVGIAVIRAVIVATAVVAVSAGIVVAIHTVPVAFEHAAVSVVAAAVDVAVGCGGYVAIAHTVVKHGSTGACGQHGAHQHDSQQDCNQAFHSFIPPAYFKDQSICAGVVFTVFTRICWKLVRRKIF